MKFVIERDAALRALILTNRIAPRRQTIPMLGHVLIIAGKSRISLTTTDMDRRLEAEIVGGGTSKTGTTTVNASNLLAFVRATTEGSQVEAELIDDTLVLRSGRARASLPTLPAADFPHFQANDRSVQLLIAGDALAAAIDRVAHAQSDEATRYYLNGVYLHAHNDKLRLVSTDGHRLGLTDIELSKPLPDGLPGLIIPRQSINELKQLASDAKRNDLSIEISETQIRCTAEAIEFNTKVVDGTFPDYERVIPSQNECRFSTTSAALNAAVVRCATLGDATHGVKLDVGKRTAQLTRSHPDAGSVSDEIDVDLTAKPAATGFNSSYMTEALAALGSASVDIEFTPGGPIVLRDPGDRDGHLQLVMAMRV